MFGCLNGVNFSIFFRRHIFNQNTKKLKMDPDLYDEFGNYVGPDLESEDDSSEEEREDRDEEERMEEEDDDQVTFKLMLIVYWLCQF